MATEEGQYGEGSFVKARSSVVWILAILTAFGAVWWIEANSGKDLIGRAPAQRQQDAAATPVLKVSRDVPADPAPRPLNAQEQRWARVAWTYFERNTDAATGLAASVEGYPATTMWDTGSHLLGLVAAHDLGLVDRAQFDARASKALAALARLPLFGNALPNKSYDVRSLGMTDYRNQPSAGGVGWSAIDLGRLVVALQGLAWRHPQHAPAVRDVLARWDWRQLARDGQLHGAQAQDNGAAPRLLQEGRLGYEQYAARALALVGLDTSEAADWRPNLQEIDVDGIAVPADRRDPQRFGAQNFIVSDPYILSGLELGWDRWTREFAWRVYRAQEARSRRTGVLTAVTEDHVDQAPYFVYNAVWSGGKPWVTVTEQGEDLPALRTLSVKAAFGWHALYRNDHTQKLVEAVAAVHDPARGWMAGVYEEGKKPNQSVNANTNGVVLQSLAFIARGRALQYK